MRTGSVSDQPMVELFCSLAAQKANGRLEIRQGKKRRGFYFEGGRISFTKSNLKSESLSRLKELHPDEGESALMQRQGRQRLMSALGTTEGDFEFEPNVPPKTRSPVDLMSVVWLAIDQALESTAIDTRFAGLDSRFPLCDPQGVTLDDLPLKDVLRDFIYTLDGSRSLNEVLEFVPTEPELARRALYLALIAGVVSLEERESGGVAVTGTHAELDELDELDEPQSSGLDLSALIAAEVGEDDDDEDPFADEPEIQSDEVLTSRLHNRLEELEAAENYFEVLGVHWDATDSTYRKAYFALANELHPDRWKGRSADLQALAGEVFAKISEAWGVLGEDEKRKSYIDREIRGIKTEDELAMEKVQAILAAEDVFKAGLALYRRGKITSSHERFQEAYEMVPEEAEFRAYYGYTTWHLSQGRDELEANDAHMMVEKAVESHVKLDAGVVLLGLIYKGKGQPKRAMACFKRALEMNPHSAEAERHLRRLASEMKRAKAKKADDDRKAKGLFGRFFGKKD